MFPLFELHANHTFVFLLKTSIAHLCHNLWPPLLLPHCIQPAVAWPRVVRFVKRVVIRSMVCVRRIQTICKGTQHNRWIKLVGNRLIRAWWHLHGMPFSSEITKHTWDLNSNLLPCLETQKQHQITSRFPTCLNKSWRHWSVQSRCWSSPGSVSLYKL